MILRMKPIGREKYFLVLLLIVAYSFLFSNFQVCCEDSWTIKKICGNTDFPKDLECVKFLLINEKTIMGIVTEIDTEYITIKEMGKPYLIEEHLPAIFSGIEGDSVSWYRLECNLTAKNFINKTIFEYYTSYLKLPRDIIKSFEPKSPLTAGLWALSLGWVYPAGHYYTNDEGIANACMWMKGAGVIISFASMMLSFSDMSGTTPIIFNIGLYGLFGGSWVIDIVDAPFSAIRHNSKLKEKYNLPVESSITNEK